MLAELERLALADSTVPLGVLARGSAIDDARLSAVEHAITVGALQADTDPLGYQEGDHWCHEHGNAKEVGDRVQRDVELGGDYVVSSANPQHPETCHRRNTKSGTRRVVAWTIQHMVLGLVTGPPRFDEGVYSHEAEEQPHQAETRDGHVP